MAEQETKVVEEVKEEKEKVVAEPKPEPKAESNSLEVELKNLGLIDETVNILINDLGIGSVEDIQDLTEKDLTDAGIKVAQVRKLVKKFNLESGKEEEVKASPTGFRVTSPMMGGSLLPTVPTDDGWLASFKVGGVLKVNQTTYIAAIRAALSNRTGISEIPKKLVAMMENFAEQNEQPVTEEFYALSEQLTRTSYAEIFAAIPGANGKFVTEARKKKVLNSIQEKVWPALASCYMQLDQWFQTWTNMSANPANLIALMQGIQMGPGVNAAPDTGALRDAGDDLCNAINRSLSGVGVSVAAAMSYDYLKVREVIEDPDLPTKVGLANREQLFKSLGVTVDSNLIRTENNLIKFTLGFIEASNQSAEIEANYFSELYMVGAQINWRALGVNVDMASTAAGGLKNLSGQTL